MEKINLAKNAQYRSDKSGPTQEINHWSCSAPHPPLKITLRGNWTNHQRHSNGKIIYSSLICVRQMHRSVHRCSVFPTVDIFKVRTRTSGHICEIAMDPYLF